MKILKRSNFEGQVMVRWRYFTTTLRGYIFELKSFIDIVLTPGWFRCYFLLLLKFYKRFPGMNLPNVMISTKSGLSKFRHLKFYFHTALLDYETKRWSFNMSNSRMSTHVQLCTVCIPIGGSVIFFITLFFIILFYTTFL